MGGCKTYGGRKTYQRTPSPENFWTLQKSFWSALSWIFVQEKQSTDTWGGWKTYRRRGVQNPFLGGVSYVRFSTPLFFPPPYGVLLFLTFRIPHKRNRGLVGGSLKIFNLAWKLQDLDFFSILGLVGVAGTWGRNAKLIREFSALRVENAMIFCNCTLRLSRRLAATESIAVQWVLMALHPMGSRLDHGFVCIVRPFAPLKNGPPCLVTMGGPTHLWLGPRISSTH